MVASFFQAGSSASMLGREAAASLASAMLRRIFGIGGQPFGRPEGDAEDMYVFTGHIQRHRIFRLNRKQQRLRVKAGTVHRGMGKPAAFFQRDFLL